MAKCYQPFIMSHSDSRKYGPISIILPCGKCLACKENKSQEWTLRILHELDNFSEASFVTLTYKDQSLPKFGSLSPKHLKDFFKRLRKKLKGKEVKYYACGEYGDDTHRPHYHVILFGVDDVNLVSDTWGFGLVHSGTVTPQSAKYVTQYINKRYTTVGNEEVYLKNNLVIPFQRASQGLGLSWAIKNKDQIVDELSIGYKGTNYTVPRYYKKKLGITTEYFNELIDDKLIEEFIKLNRLGYLTKSQRKQRIAEIREQAKRNYLSKAKLFNSDSRIKPD